MASAQVSISVSASVPFRARAASNTRRTRRSLQERAGNRVERPIELRPRGRARNFGHPAHGVAHEIERIADPDEPLRADDGARCQVPAGIPEGDQMSREVSAIDR
jgi:hypothetical protein